MVPGGAIGRRRRARGWSLFMALAFLLTTSAVAHAGPSSRRKRANLPPGWSWPPSKWMKRKGRECLRDLSQLGVRWKRARRRRMIPTPVVVPDMELRGLKLSPTYRDPPFVMDCHLARALARQAPFLRELGIRELRFSTIHDYRRVRLAGKRRRALSRHALGLAIDVFEVVLEDGTTLEVESDYWSSDRTLRAADVLLHSFGRFRAVLTPSVDPVSHDDHFHLEAKYELPRAARIAARKKARRQRMRRAQRRRARKARQARRREARRERRRETRKERRRQAREERGRETRNERRARRREARKERRREARKERRRQAQKKRRREARKERRRQAQKKRRREAPKRRERTQGDER